MDTRYPHPLKLTLISMALTEPDMPGRDRPLLLAMETATPWGSLALIANGNCLAEYSLKSQLTHSRRLLKGLTWLLAETGLLWADIDGIAVSLGPGSFTGLRIGLSTAKGLAMATGKPLLGVPTLAGLAAQFVFVPHLLCPVLDARKKEVYAAFFRCDADGRPQRLSPDMVTKPAQLVSLIKEPTLFIGDGVAVISDFFKSEAAGAMMMMPPPALNFPRAAGIGMLADELWKKKEFLDPGTAVPIYVRASDAELNFLMRS